MQRVDSPAQWRHLSRMRTRLVLDTVVSPSPDQSELTGRHLRYEMDELWLDLRLGPPPGSPESVLVGQLATRLDPLKSLAGFPVFLMAGEEFLAQATSNRVGDFKVAYKADAAAMLCLLFGNEQMIEVPVNPLYRRPFGDPANRRSRADLGGYPSGQRCARSARRGAAGRWDRDWSRTLVQLSSLGLWSSGRSKPRWRRRAIKSHDHSRPAPRCQANVK